MEWDRLFLILALADAVYLMLVIIMYNVTAKERRIKKIIINSATFGFGRYLIFFASDQYYSRLQWDGNRSAAIAISTPLVALGLSILTMNFVYALFYINKKRSSLKKIKTYQNNLETIPEDSNFRNKLAKAYHEHEETKEALKIYKKTLEIDPDDIEALIGYGTILCEHGNFIEAEKTHREALEKYPNQAKLVESLAEILRKKEKYDMDAYRKKIIQILVGVPLSIFIGLVFVIFGINTYERQMRWSGNRAAAFNAGIGPAIVGGGIILVSSFYFLYRIISLIRDERAVRHNKDVVKHMPEDRNAWKNLGMALTGQGKYNEAIAAYKTALDLKPEDAEAYSSLGSVLVAQGRLEEAVASYKKSLEIDPHDSDTWISLANVFKKLGKPEAALAAQKQALEYNP